MSIPAKPRLSATVLLIRDRAQLEVLMVRRHYQIDFASGALVFPGGKVNPEDSSADWQHYVDCELSGDQMTARIAAVREAFEESGVLLARHKSNAGKGGPLVSADIADKLGPFRAAVDRQEQSFLELIRENDLVLALDTLVHFGHWVTPEMMPKRFDTHFYMAPTPPSQIASHDGRETTDAIWVGPAKALELEASGEATIIFPTRMNLIKLAAAQTAAQAAELFGQGDVVTVVPQMGTNDLGQKGLFIPAEAGYGQTFELLSKIQT